MLQAKEGLALINGTDGMLAFTRRLVQMLTPELFTPGERVIRAGAIIDADANWWTGHTTADTIKSYLKRYYTYGMGSARYAMTRGDWTHPDVRNYATPEALRALLDALRGEQ